MPLIKLNRANGTKEDVNTAHIIRVIDNESAGVVIVFTSGESIGYTNSARSVRGYVRKAEEPKQATPAKEEPEA